MNLFEYKMGPLLPPPAWASLAVPTPSIERSHQYWGSRVQMAVDQSHRPTAAAAACQATEIGEGEGGRRRPGWWSRWRPLGFRVARGGGGELALRWAAVVGGGGKEGGRGRGHVLC